VRIGGRADRLLLDVIESHPRGMIGRSDIRRETDAPHWFLSPSMHITLSLRVRERSMRTGTWLQLENPEETGLCSASKWKAENQLSCFFWLVTDYLGMWRQFELNDDKYAVLGTYNCCMYILYSVQTISDNPERPFRSFIKRAPLATACNFPMRHRLGLASV